MTNFGYTLMCEQSPPDALAREVQMAEQAGFDFSVTSDHYEPWLEEQGRRQPSSSVGRAGTVDSAARAMTPGCWI